MDSVNQTYSQNRNFNFVRENKVNVTLTARGHPFRVKMLAPGLDPEMTMIIMKSQMQIIN